MRKSCSWLFMTCSGFGAVKNPNFPMLLKKVMRLKWVVSSQAVVRYLLVTGYPLSTDRA